MVKGELACARHQLTKSDKKVKSKSKSKAAEPATKRAASPAPSSSSSSGSNDASDSESDYSSSDTDEDDDGEQLTPALDAAILRTLAKIKKGGEELYAGENVLQTELETARKAAEARGLKKVSAKQAENQVSSCVFFFPVNSTDSLSPSC